jgi:hypothetical protein
MKVKKIKEKIKGKIKRKMERKDIESRAPARDVKT